MTEMFKQKLILKSHIRAQRITKYEINVTSNRKFNTFSYINRR